MAILPNLPDDFDVYAVGVYRGRKHLDIQIGPSGNDVGQLEVVVNHPAKPIVLVLSAYDPTVWRIGRTTDSKIAGVLVSGYHTQVLTGIEKSVPHAISSGEQASPLPRFLAYEASPALLKMNDTVKSITGRDIKHFFCKPDADGVVYIGERPRDLSMVVYSQDLPVHGYLRPESPVGQKGIAQLVEAGKLRPATKRDIDDWADKASAPYKRFNPELRVRHSMHLGRTYVVLQSFTLPDGLYGGHSCSFIIPERSISLPEGPRGHCFFYLWDGSVVGPWTPSQRTQPK